MNPRAHHALLALPFVWHLGLAPWVNDISWQPLGLPFPMVWQMGGILLTSLIIGIVYRLDQALRREPSRDAQP